MEQVVLVDEKDEKVGLMEKLEAHQNGGRLHRAVSVLLYRLSKKNGVEVLLQKRSKAKPLWPLFWSNTVCTHPRDGESFEACGVRRLREEMGIEIEEGRLRFLFKLLYRAPYNEDLSEHELDGVMVGQWDGKLALNSEEAADFRWAGWQDLREEIAGDGKAYTPWFKKLVANKKVEQAIRE